MSIDDKKLLISIVIPTHNRLTYLKEAVESSLSQTYDNIEIIICDNASEDGTENYIKGLKDGRIRYVRHDKLIPPLSNWNSWIALSEGELVTFLPDDDKLGSRFIEACANEFIHDNKTCLVKTGCFIINETSEIMSNYLPFKDGVTTGRQYVFDRLNPRYSELSLGSGYMFRKKDFLELGGFVFTGFPQLHTVDDYLWFRIVLKGGVVRYLNEELWSYRCHSSNMAIVQSLSDFKTGCYIYADMLFDLLSATEGQPGNIIDYVKLHYGENLIKNRIVSELGRNRKVNFFKAIRYLYDNRKIVAEYYGTKKILHETCFIMIFALLPR